MNPKISIITPVYNKEVGIKRSIQSVLSQDYDNFELVIVDDGSKDESMNIVRSFEDNRIVIVEQRNAGPAAARNNGTSHSTGEWLIFLDADDELEPNALTEIARLANRYRRAGFLSFNFYVEYGGERNVKFRGNKNETLFFSSYLAWLYGWFFPCQGSFVLRRDIALSNPYPEQFRRWEDTAMLLDAMRKTKVAYSDFKIFTYHVSLAQASRPTSNTSIDYICNIKLNGKPLLEKVCLYKLYKMEEKRIKDIYMGDEFPSFVKFVHNHLLLAYYHYQGLEYRYQRIFGQAGKRFRRP